MKINKMIQQMVRLASLAALASLAGSNTLQAQTWQTYQYPGGTAEGSGIAADASGNVFSAGNVNDASGIVHGITLKTDTTLGTWYLSDDTNPDSTQYKSCIWDFGLDAGRNLYSIGQLTPKSTGITYWYVRKSSDKGLSWTNAGAPYQYAAGQSIDATGFAADDSGNIYVVGWGRDATKSSYIHWLVRKSTDSGQTWKLVDDVTGTSGANGAGFVPGAGVFVAGGRFIGPGHSWLVRRSPNGEPGTWSTVDGPFAQGAARAVGGDNQGNVYVSGSMFVTTQAATKHTAAQGYYAWVTRKSSNGGNTNTWSTVDTFTYTPNMGGYGPVGIGTNAAGNVVVVGNAYDGQKNHWIVRTPDSSGVWHTIDDFQLSPGYDASASGVTTDVTGSLLVTGSANDATGSHWIVRRLANTSP